MASKTSARSAGRTTRSQTGSRSGSRPAPTRKPAKRRQGHAGGGLAAAGLAVGRGARATWQLAARGAGTAARSIGHARDIAPGHRRDGIALGLLGIAVVVGASCWFDAARPVGQWIDGALRVIVGSGVVLIPLVAAAIAVLLMRTQPNPESRPRLILGAAMIALPSLGLWHLWSGSPETPA